MHALNTLYTFLVWCSHDDCSSSHNFQCKRHTEETLNAMYIASKHATHSYVLILSATDYIFEYSRVSSQSYLFSFHSSRLFLFPFFSTRLLHALYERFRSKTARNKCYMKNLIREEKATKKTYLLKLLDADRYRYWSRIRYIFILRIFTPVFGSYFALRILYSSSNI